MAKRALRAPVILGGAKGKDAMTTQIHEQTQAAWDAIARGYDEFVTPTHHWIASEGLKLASLRAGERFLDVASGSGALSVAAARLGAKVTAVDHSSVMLDRLRNRASAENLNIETQVMDGHALGFEADRFDIAGSQFGVMLFPDMPRGIRELARVVKPRGRVLVIAYGAPAKIEFFHFFVTAIQAVVPEFKGPPKDPTPLPFQLQDPEKLRREMLNARLNDVRVNEITETLAFESGQQIWDWLVNSNPIVSSVLGELRLTGAQTEQIREDLEKLIRQRAGASSHAELTNPVNVGVGTK
jgi:ubiquinone/menaquinone biosynthesis C-methylase UbiE